MGNFFLLKVNSKKHTIRTEMNIFSVLKTHMNKWKILNKQFRVNCYRKCFFYTQKHIPHTVISEYVATKFEKTMVTEETHTTDTNKLK